MENSKIFEMNDGSGQYAFSNQNEEKDLQEGKTVYFPIARPKTKEELFASLPDKKYNIIYADPPWAYQDKHCQGSAEDQYPTVDIEDLKKLPVADIAADDCILFMWATYPKLDEALELIKAWGFEYKTIGFQWIKQNKNGDGYFFGLGRWTRGNSEPCLIAVKGKPKRVNADVGQLVFSPLRRHSQKPDCVKDKIVRLVGDLPRIELFARYAAPGWDVWGNEAPEESDKAETV